MDSNPDLVSQEKIKTSKIKAPLLKIVLVGDSEVGKTTLINCFIVYKNNENRMMASKMRNLKNQLASITPLKSLNLNLT